MAGKERKEVFRRGMLGKIPPEEGGGRGENRKRKPVFREIFGKGRGKIEKKI